jgi:hypothetical protein
LAPENLNLRRSFTRAENVNLPLDLKRPWSQCTGMFLQAKSWTRLISPRWIVAWKLTLPPFLTAPW